MIEYLLFREVTWWVLENKIVILKYIKLIKNIYARSVISVKTSGNILRMSICTNNG
jgi:hypothetical protein